MHIHVLDVVEMYDLLLNALQKPCLPEWLVPGLVGYPQSDCEFSFKREPYQTPMPAYWAMQVEILMTQTLFSFTWVIHTFSYLCFLVDGGFDEWGNYSECSVSCGGGNQMRTRTCTNPVPQNGGQPCVGAHSETKECNTQPCPGTVLNQSY